MVLCENCCENVNELIENPNPLSPYHLVCKYCANEIQDNLSIEWMIDEDSDEFYDHED